MNRNGISGAILQMINHGISTGALFLLVGVIYDRRHSRMLDDFGGLAKVMPWYTLFFIIITLSSIGLPGTNGFVGEFMILAGSFFSRTPIGFGSSWFIMTLLATTGVIFAAVYMLHAVLRIFWGKVVHTENESLTDLNRREVVSLLPLIVMVFWIGLYPKFFLDKMNPSVDSFVTNFTVRYEEGRRTAEPRLVDFDELARRSEAAGALVMARPADEEVQP
jgi:NADH-quinone oxidoreductase subunit M